MKVVHFGMTCLNRVRRARQESGLRTQESSVVSGQWSVVSGVGFGCRVVVDYTS